MNGIFCPNHIPNVKVLKCLGAKGPTGSTGSTLPTGSDGQV